MRSALATVLAIASASLTTGCGRTGATDGKIPFPEGYRDWTHVKSGLIDDPRHPYFDRFGGIHHIYANAIAMEGYSNGSFADGAILVYDLHTLVPLPDGSIDQGDRRHIDVMVRDNTRFATTGGWGYEEFSAAEPHTPTLSSSARQTCAACHATRQDHGGVFSTYRK